MTPPDFWDHAWKGSLLGPDDGADASTWLNEIDRRKMLFVSPRLPLHGRALEVGCGSARLLCRVGRETQLDLCGIDRSPNALNLARRTAATFDVAIETCLGDAATLPIADDEVDVVLSGGLLEHFREPVPILAEMVRVLRPGGLLYADVVPRKLSLYRLSELRRLLRDPWMRAGIYESSFGPEMYREWLLELGLEDVQAMWCGVYPRLTARFPSRARRLIERATRSADSTLVADLLGWYFMISARKGSPQC